MNYPNNLYLESEIFSSAKDISNAIVNYFTDCPKDLGKNMPPSNVPITII